MELFSDFFNVMLETGALEGILIACGAGAPAVIGVRMYKKFRSKKNAGN
tara:strand:- start:421 stop:567 length:147 start_codon:yes stop_codon:yes gene_type:complete